MTIETKFDVGQEVWLIDEEWILNAKTCSECGSIIGDGRGSWYASGPHKISEVIFSVGWGGPHYVCDEGLPRAEADLFPTEAEAQAECDRRNGSDQHAAAPEPAPA